jgi:hypothetical protein
MSPGRYWIRLGRLLMMAASSLTCAFRLSQLCDRPCYVASGGWRSLPPLVSGWAAPRPAT